MTELLRVQADADRLFSIQQGGRQAVVFLFAQQRAGIFGK